MSGRHREIERQVEWSMPATSLAAGIAVIAASSALAGVVAGLLWLLYVAVAVTIVVATGLVLRSLRTPAPLVPVAQVVALLFLVVSEFTRGTVLVLLPTPSALRELGGVLSESIQEVQAGVPPVPATPAMLCLVVLCLGLVAVLVDVLTVAADTPAASGLVLLCVFAVPASLSDTLLPWWTFALGLGGFAGLLAVDRQQRHRDWRGRIGLPSAARDWQGQWRSAAVVTTAAVVLALLVGSSVTVIGTAGRLPGGAGGFGSDSTGGLGIKPFTQLTGMLEHKGNVQLFRVRGLNSPTYLRTLTLRQYVPNQGWELGGAMPEGVPPAPQLPPAPGDTGTDRTARIDIEPVNWDDVWLPVYGRPRGLTGVPDNWRYDRTTGAVYSEQPHRPGRYVEDASLSQPTAEQLRDVDDLPMDVDPVYRRIGGVDPRIVQLSQRLTAGAGTEFDKAASIYRFFTTPTNGFTYAVRTANPVTGDALYDFLFNSRTGFCEQYASAMAVMLRVIGLPSRVAIGFTAGFQDGDHRTITSQDAHAWVEVQFPGYGWVVFDPTPLADGRAVVPPYLMPNPVTGQPGQQAAGSAPRPSATPATPTAARPSGPGIAPTAAQQARPDDGEPGWLGWALTVVLALAIGFTALRWYAGRPPPGVTTAEDERAAARRERLRRLIAWGDPAGVALWLAAAVLAAGLLSWWLAAAIVLIGLAVAPWALRELHRRGRLRTVAALGARAATAAWQELVAESADRGVVPPRSETVRLAAKRMVRDHGLCEQGEQGLSSVVGAVERAWYGGCAAADPGLPEAVDEVRRSLERNAPLSLRDRLMPRSVLRRPRGEPAGRS
jgi:transglutaminase-like putative cysteine protease